MRHAALLAASATLVAGQAYAEAPPTRTVMQLRLGHERIDAFVWKTEGGDYLVDNTTLALLNVQAPEGDRIRLSSIPGLHYQTAPDEGALILECASACYDAQIISNENTALPLTPSPPGAFMNVDLTGASVEGVSDASALFEVGFFGGAGFGGFSWLTNANQKKADGVDLIRLNTQWTIDDRARRTRLVLGDSVLRSDFGGALRIGGIQWGTDFSVDPSYQSYPLPTISGEAAAPSVVDLYQDGLLRMRQDVNAGPFEIQQAPVLDGAGRAQVVVRDALGREQVYSQSFYVDATLLRQGVSDYSLGAGMERANFAYKSNDYRNAFAAARYRYGIRSWLTALAQTETSDDGDRIGAGAAFAAINAGRFDISYARSASDGREGESLQTAWRFLGDPIALGYSWEHSTDGYWRLGWVRNSADRTLQTAFLALNPVGFGAASITWIDDRNERQAMRTLGASYSPHLDIPGDLQFNFTRIDDARAHYFAGMRFTMQIGGATASISLDHAAGRLNPQATKQTPADPAGGWGWSAAMGGGEVSRLRLGAEFIGARNTAQIEYARVGGREGVRGSYQTSFVFVGGRIMKARSIRSSFALVESGVPDVDVLIDNRRVGKTDIRGRFLVTDLRPYETNRISLDVAQLPLDMPVKSSDLRLTPAPQSGVIARFETVSANGGEIRVVDESGAPLPLGSLLLREDDGERFPIGHNGRAYISGLKTPATYVGDGGCTMTLWPEQIAQNRQITCKAATQ